MSELKIPEDLLVLCNKLTRQIPLTAAEAWPLIERITALEDQLKTVLDREAATQSRHDERVTALEAELAEARAKIAGLQARLEAADKLAEEREKVISELRSHNDGLAGAIMRQSKLPDSARKEGK